MGVYICPVCDGRGLVPNNFYTSVNCTWTSTSTTPERCRSCDGTGYIITNLDISKGFNEGFIEGLKEAAKISASKIGWVKKSEVE